MLLLLVLLLLTLLLLLPALLSAALLSAPTRLLFLLAGTLTATLLASALFLLARVTRILVRHLGTLHGAPLDRRTSERSGAFRGTASSAARLSDTLVANGAH